MPEQHLSEHAAAALALLLLRQTPVGAYPMECRTVGDAEGAAAAMGALEGSLPNPQRSTPPTLPTLPSLVTSLSRTLPTLPPMLVTPSLRKLPTLAALPALPKLRIRMKTATPVAAAPPSTASTQAASTQTNGETQTPTQPTQSNASAVRVREAIASEAHIIRGVYKVMKLSGMAAEEAVVRIQSVATRMDEDPVRVHRVYVLLNGLVEGGHMDDCWAMLAQL